MDFNELIDKTYTGYLSALFSGGGEAAKRQLFNFLAKADTIKDAPTYVTLSEESKYLYDDFEWFASQAHTDLMLSLLSEGSKSLKVLLKEWLVMAVTFNSRGK